MNEPNDALESSMEPMMEHNDIVLPLNPPVETGVVQPPTVVEEDVIYRTVNEDESPDTVLKAVMEGMAEEQYALRTLRKSKQNEGKDISHIALKRGTLLKYMAETTLQRKSLMGSSDDLNIHGMKFREIFKMFLDVINQTFEQTSIPQEYRDLFFNRLTKNLEGWEEKAEEIIKSIESPR